MTSSNYIEQIATEIRSAVPPEDIPEGDSHQLFLAYAVLALAKGNQVDRRDVHNAWSAWMTQQDPSHDSIRPYEDLPSDVKGEDDPYVSAIRRVAKRIS